MSQKKKKKAAMPVERLRWWEANDIRNGCVFFFFFFFFFKSNGHPDRIVSKSVSSLRMKTRVLLKRSFAFIDLVLFWLR